MKSVRSWIDFAEIFRFGIAGGTNTLLTLALYEVLLFAFSAGVAYAISWVCGILFSAIVYPNQVFRVTNTPTSTRAYAVLVIIAAFLVGTAVLALFQRVGINPRLAIFLVLPITSSLAYVSMRALFTSSITGINESRKEGNGGESAKEWR